MDTFV